MWGGIRIVSIVGSARISANERSIKDKMRINAEAGNRAPSSNVR